MNRSTLRLFTPGLAFAAVAWLVADSEAQNRLQPKEGEEAILFDSQRDNLERSGAEKRRWDDLRAGKVGVNEDTKVNQDLIAKAARFYAYRLTMPLYHGLGEEDATKEKSNIQLTIANLIRESTDPMLLSMFRARPRRPGQPNTNQLEFVKLFGKELTKCLRDVFGRNSKPIVRVNAARMLALLAETEQEEVADTLVAVLQNPRESDGVKLYALRGLKVLFEAGSPEQSVFKDPKREARTIAALQAYIARKPDLPTDPMEVEGLRYVRREAVRALGMTRHPIVPTVKDASGQTAWWLLKVARKDGLTPEPSLTEQAEAAIGASQLRPNKDLQLDYVAHHVGGVVVDFLNEFNRAKLGAAEANIPWKLYATRLGIALDTLKDQAKNAPGKTGSYVDKVVDQARGALKPMEAKDPNPNPTVLDQWLRKNPPPAATVYKSIPDSSVKAPAGAAE